MDYATQTEVATWLGYLDASGNPDTSQLASDIDRLISRASELMDSVLRHSFYSTDASGNMDDEDDLAAMADAVCAQIEAWEESGDELGAASAYQSVSIGSVSLSGASARVLGGQNIAPRAADALRKAGLLPGRPIV